MSLHLSEILSFYCSFVTRNLNLKFYTNVEYDRKNMCDFFRFFVKFVSSCARYVYEKPMCIGYVPILLILFNINTGITIKIGTTNIISYLYKT
jgi:hypothetical protein